MTGIEGQPPHDPSGRFDYFGDQVAGDGTLCTVACEDVALPSDPSRRGPQRRWRAIFKLFFVSFCAWFAWQYYDVARYSFQPDQPPLELGDVTSFTPDLVPHNGYVCVDGISEHRGMTQKVSRVIGERAVPYWYFRLVGSRGVFVEVDPDVTRYGTTQRMHICGRAVDPGRSANFAQLIGAYEQLFGTEVAAPIRIIEGDMPPGAHRARYTAVLLGLLGLVGLQLKALWPRLRS